MSISTYYACVYAWIAVNQNSDPISNEIAFDVAVSAGIVFG